MRPDNFITTYIGYRTRQQQEIHPLRRIMYIMSATAGVEVKEEKIYPLPLLDEEEEQETAPESKYERTEEEKERIEARHRLIVEQLKQQSNGGNT